MKEKIKKWLKPVLFTTCGALVGLAYYSSSARRIQAYTHERNPKISIIIPANRNNKAIPCLKSAGYNIIEVNDYAD